MSFNLMMHNNIFNPIISSNNGDHREYVQAKNVCLMFSTTATNNKDPGYALWAAYKFCWAAVM